MAIRKHVSVVLVAVAMLVVGLTLGGLWPQTPLHATTTDRGESFAIATGMVDADVEAVYFLDFLTGDLSAAVLSPLAGKFNAFYTYNVSSDLGVEPGKAPKYLMATGVASMRRSAKTAKLGAAVVYVAETNSGRVAAYALPWDASMANAGKGIMAKMVPLDMRQFRTAAVRGGASQ